jgi:hypothetical protein
MQHVSGLLSVSHKLTAELLQRTIAPDDAAEYDVVLNLRPNGMFGLFKGWRKVC